QIGIHITLHRDLMGPSFVPDVIELSYAPHGDFGLTEDLLGCPVRFGQAANRLIFASEWLDVRPKLGNATTYAAIRALCDDLIANLSARTGIAGKIRGLLVQNLARPPNLSEVARLLGSTDRTLRRQLKEQGTS